MVGDMGLIGHLWKMLSFRSADIIATAQQPIVDEIIRKILSDIAWKQLLTVWVLLCQEGQDH